jgi:hypothetical protein
MVGAGRFHAGWIAFAIICFIAAVVAGFTMYLAWQQNPQLAFHEDGVIHWDAWLTVGLTWFVAIAGVPCIIAFAALLFSFFRGSR